MAYDYYSNKLSAERLEQCYELAPVRVQQYLSSEIEHVVSLIPKGGRVLELGCGYGRVLGPLAATSSFVCGIDISIASLRLARRRLAAHENVSLAAMDGSRPAFKMQRFDVVCCLQNGISAFHADQRRLIEAAVDMAKPRGRALFSSYADEFWEHRLEWFRIQSAHGLVGEIDEAATVCGTIVCKDGFTATTVTPQGFSRLSSGLGTGVFIEVVDGSSVFCEIST